VEGRGTTRSQDAMNTGATPPRYGWNRIPWKKVQRKVCKRQKRIYQTACRGDIRTGRALQRLLMHSWSAKLLAVRRITQDTQGKKTAGVEGVQSLTPQQRRTLAQTLTLGDKAAPVRRVWRPNPGANDRRPLGIPPIHDRALQALAHRVREPAWAARFTPNRSGFRPGRACHEAIAALVTSIGHKAKDVLAADIEQGFDRIAHAAGRKKIHTSPRLRRQVQGWLKAGVYEDGQWFPTEAGTRQGGTSAPFMANMARHGLETIISKRLPRSGSRGLQAPNIVVYADALVIFHEDRQSVRQCQDMVAEWLQDRGLRLKPSKTRITHTLRETEETPGCDFLGFPLHHYPAGKTQSGKDGRGRLQGCKTLIKPSQTAIRRQVAKRRKTIDHPKHATQETLLQALHPQMVGWSKYYAQVTSARVLQTLDHTVYAMLKGWAVSRHPNKKKHWMTNTYWRGDDGQGWTFPPPSGGACLARHAHTAIQRQVKVQGARRPYDGDWVDWSTRVGHHPDVPPRVAKLLKQPQGRWRACGLSFTDGDKVEVDHLLPKKDGGRDTRDNVPLLHRHCHETKTARETGCHGTYDTRHVAEEPDERQRSCPVL
jgi:RNA-directed DNA polymerase